MRKEKELEPQQNTEKNHTDEKVTKTRSKFSTYFYKMVSTKKRKIALVFVLVIILAVVILAIPSTRYAILGQFIKKEVVLKIIDSESKKAVTDVKVELGGFEALSDNEGTIKLNSIPVGNYELKISKSYYESSITMYNIPVLSSPKSDAYNLKATGRQVTLTVHDKINNVPIEDVSVITKDAKATTGKNGEATVVVPVSADTIQASLSKDGFNPVNVELNVKDNSQNVYSLTSSGDLYYLSKATGDINIMKSNLDGTQSKVVIPGTGQESDYETSLLSSTDWAYSALSATRTDNKQRLYLLDASTDELSVIDEGDATFNLVGWTGHDFIYTVIRNKGNVWDDKHQALKKYNAESRKITTLDETSGMGTGNYDYTYNVFNNVYIIKNELVYSKQWYFSNSYYASLDTNKVPALFSINISNNTVTNIKNFPTENSINLKLYEPQGIYIQVSSPGSYYEYEDGKVKQVNNINENQFNSFYPTFLLSPSAKQTLWYEPRDGKNTIMIGDALGKTPKIIGNLSEFTPYGWYGKNDQYILLSKNNSELYISPASKVIGENGYQPLKITDYHKTRTYPGYGSGYGGQ
jgi:hypothetical protein